MVQKALEWVLGIKPEPETMPPKPERSGVDWLLRERPTRCRVFGVEMNEEWTAALIRQQEIIRDGAALQTSWRLHHATGSQYRRRQHLNQWQIRRAKSGGRLLPNAKTL